MYFNDDITDKMGFDLVASAYDKARPDYPEQIYRDALLAMGVKNQFHEIHFSRVLEIGSGSGQATSRLLEIAENLDCIEPGDNFSRMLRETFKSNSNLKIFNSTFEDFTTRTKYDLVFSACALHWLPKELAYAKIKSLLHPRGWLFCIWNQPHFSRQVYSVIDRTFENKIPNFSIPCGKQSELELFETGFDDFSKNRGFVNCTRNVYSFPRVVSDELLVELIWSYVSATNLSSEIRSQLYFDLKYNITSLDVGKHNVLNYFPVVWGQAPEAKRTNA